MRNQCTSTVQGGGEHHTNVNLFFGSVPVVPARPFPEGTDGLLLTTVSFEVSVHHYQFHAPRKLLRVRHHHRPARRERVVLAAIAAEYGDVLVC